MPPTQRRPAKSAKTAQTRTKSVIPADASAPLVGVIMGSASDTKIMQFTAEMLRRLGVPYEERVVSAHRTPDAMFRYAETAASRGLLAIIAGAGGAAHLPGMVAAKTYLPVIGIPVESAALKGLDSLLSIAQMPAGVPVATVAVGRAGAINAAILAARIVALQHPAVAQALADFQAEQQAAAADPKAVATRAAEEVTSALSAVREERAALLSAYLDVEALSAQRRPTKKRTKPTVR